MQYVVAVADTRSFRRAAERCLVSQPSLSVQIAELEHALDIRLFERSRPIRPTAAGDEFIARARRVLVELEALIEGARRFAEPLTGLLRLGVIPTLAPYVLPTIDPALRQAFPRLSLAWTEDKTDALIERLATGELDAALIALRPGDDLDHEPVGVDPFVLAAPPDHPLATRRGPVRLDDLDRERVLLLDDGHCFRDQALAVCSRAGATEIGFRATSLSTLAQMVAGRAGITLLPQVAVAVENRRGALAVRRFADPAPQRTLVLAWRRKAALEDSFRVLARAAAAAYAQNFDAEARSPNPPSVPRRRGATTQARR